MRKGVGDGVKRSTRWGPMCAVRGLCSGVRLGRSIVTERARIVVRARVGGSGIDRAGLVGSRIASWHRTSSIKHRTSVHRTSSTEHQASVHRTSVHQASSIRRSGVGIRSPTDAPQDQGNIKNRCMPYAHNLSHPPRKEKNQNEKNRMEWNRTEQSRADSAKTRRFGARSLAGARAQPEI